MANFFRETYGPTNKQIWWMIIHAGIGFAAFISPDPNWFYYLAGSANCLMATLIFIHLTIVKYQIYTMKNTLIIDIPLNQIHDAKEKVIKPLIKRYKLNISYSRIDSLGLIQVRGKMSTLQGAVMAASLIENKIDITFPYE